MVYQENAQSSVIVQGALGNTHFVNALRHLTCSPAHINALIVSTKYAHLGLYTLKVSKAGRWRYVHIDDRIPCRQSGRVHFTRNADPNETFAMLIEKAYAKVRAFLPWLPYFLNVCMRFVLYFPLPQVHGCYEAMLHGLMERTLQDLTDSRHVSS